MVCRLTAGHAENPARAALAVFVGIEVRVGVRASHWRRTSSQGLSPPLCPLLGALLAAVSTLPSDLSAVTASARLAVSISALVLLRRGLRTRFGLPSSAASTAARTRAGAGLRLDDEEIRVGLKVHWLAQSASGPGA